MADYASQALERLTRRTDQAEVFGVDGESTLVEFEANELKSLKVEQTSGLAARAMVDGRLGFAASSDPRATEWLERICLESAAEGEAVDLRFPGPSTGVAVEVYDPALADLPSSELVRMGREMVVAVREHEPNGMVNASVRHTVQETRVLNSQGSDVPARKSTLAMAVSYERVHGDDVLFGWREYGSCRLDRDYVDGAHDLGKQMATATRVTTLSRADVPVLCSPMGGIMLLLPIILGLNGKDALRGASPLGKRVGESLFGSSLSIVDDPTVNWRPGSAAFDHEGVAKGRRALVESGVLHGLLYDLTTAAKAGVPATGNGQRSLFTPPRPSFSNLIVEPGATPIAEIMARLDEALLVEMPLGLGQGNAISGAFSHNLALGFKVERGEIVGRVKNVSVAGDVYRDLKTISAVSTESEWVDGTTRFPWILLPRLNVVVKD